MIMMIDIQLSPPLSSSLSSLFTSASPLVVAARSTSGTIAMRVGCRTSWDSLYTWTRSQHSPSSIIIIIIIIIIITITVITIILSSSYYHHHHHHYHHHLVRKRSNTYCKKRDEGYFWSISATSKISTKGTHRSDSSCFIMEYATMSQSYFSEFYTTTVVVVAGDVVMMVNEWTDE